MNWLAIIVSAVAAMLLGFGWYSQWAFGKSWASLTGRTMGGGEGTGALYALIIVSAFVQAIAMNSTFVRNRGSARCIRWPK